MRPVDEIIAKLDTLTTAELERVIFAAQEMAILHVMWADPRNQDKGSYIYERVKCGKSRCKTCSEEGGHGPYWYHYTSENGKTKKRYIGKHKPEGT